MKSFLLFFIILVAAISVIPQTNLTVLYLNDTHSCLAPLGPRNNDLTGSRGGISRAATVIGNHELSGKDVLTLHSGDFSIGDLFYNKYFGVPELQILNQLGVDAMTVGNHEFDLGPSTLEAALTAAFGYPGTGFPLLSANADLSLYPGNLNHYIKPFTVKDFGDYKVGIFGLTTHETNILSNPSPVVIGEDFLTTAGTIVQELLTVEGCDFIICLSHYGILGDQALAAYVPGINLIVGGHDHIPMMPLLVGDTWIVQADPFYGSIGKIEFQINQNSITMAGNEIIKLDSSIPENNGISAVVEGLISEIENVYGPVYSQKIGNLNRFMEELAVDITKPGNHSTSAGNFIADAMRWKTGTDFAIEPGGSIAQPLYQGPVVPADLFRMTGYGFNTQNGLGFRLVTAGITGLELYKAIEIILSFIEGNDEYFPQFSGVTLKYNPDAQEGERITSIKINNSMLNPLATYSFTSNEIVFIMLDAFGIVYENSLVMDSYTEFQNLCEYTEYLMGKIKSNSDARVVAEGDEENQLMDLDEESQSVQLNICNYPNPFNPSTTISFNLNSDGHVRLTVYNTIGEEIEVLADGFKSAGKYDVTWNAGVSPSGVYFYSIQTADYTQTRKMILLK